MKVNVKKSGAYTDKYTVGVQQGNQYFTLDYAGTLTECRWYAKMFRTAIKDHDAEVIEEYMEYRRKVKKGLQ